MITQTFYLFNKAAQEFNFKKGLLLDVMCGIFSAGMSFAMDTAKPMHQAAEALGLNPLYVALPSYVVMCGGIVGLLLKDWNNVGKKPVSVLVLGGLIIILAANIVGMGMAS